MKKTAVFLLAMAMVCSLIGCGGNNESTQKKEETTTLAQEDITKEVEKQDETANEEQGFSIPTLNSYDTFPDASYWTALGLPEDFTIDIVEMEFSSKNSIFPLDAKDGNMFDCIVEDNQAAYTTLTDALWNAGISGQIADDGAVTQAFERGDVDVYDIDVKIYHAYWELDGELMDIEVRARDGARKVSVLVRYQPEI